MNVALILTLLALCCAAVASTPVDYKDGDTELEGALSIPKDVHGPTPIVLIVHDWAGVKDYEAHRADQIANLGYIGFAIDVYGKGVRPKTPEECMAEARKYYGDNALLRSRVKAALDYAATIPNADMTHMAMIGYCFGGMTVLDAARSGVNALGVVSFHGGLKTSTPAKKGEVKAKVLVLHGDADTAAPMTDVEALKKEMADAGVDCRVVIYHGAKHAFTVPGSDRAGVPGVGYDAKADKGSWEEMRKFLKEIFGA
jgi:dienelactone hydrolase